MVQAEAVYVVASSAGHLRVEVPRLYRSERARAELEQAAAAHPAVRRARANPLTARLLIEFAPQHIGAAALLAELGFSVRPGPAPARSGGLPPPFVAGNARVRAAPLYAPWHARETDEALAFFGSAPGRGLSMPEAALRLRSGPNLIPQPPAPAALQVLLNQFTSLPIILLGVSALVSLVTGGVAEAAAIGAVLVLNGAIGFHTERRAEASVASLSELVDDIVLVLRDGAARMIAAAAVVPGDILVLSPGTRIAADLRLLASQRLTIDESALTGESVPVAKDPAILSGKTALAERRNMAYRGTAVATGTGAGLAVGTGLRTEVGAIAAMTGALARPRTRTQIQLDQLGSQLIKASSAMCVAIFAIGLARGYNRLAMFKTAISLAIAAVPEGLPAVATTSLARGIGRMRARKVLIRHLHGVETIGAIQTICLDKTGTLTLNRMSAVALATVDGACDAAALDEAQCRAVPALGAMLRICVLSNESEANGGDGAASGSATEAALLALAARGGLSAPQLRAAFPLRETELRAEGRNFMRTLHADAGGSGMLVAVKGSPDEVLALCDDGMTASGRVPLDDALRARILQQNQDMAARQLRVLGFAWAQGAGATLRAARLTWAGLAGLADPLRPGMEQVIDRFHQAGIATIMLTGDQAATAYQIGKQLHLNNGADLTIVSAEQLADTAPQQLGALAASAHIFARVTPVHKLRIVRALQQAGQVVAMTGDGINDSPALRAADIGIAMGGGTEVALSAADIALKDDQLAALLEAVSQGRTISANIRKSVHFLLSSNLSEILLVAGAVGAGLGQPLTPLQLLWLNLLSDVLPAIALGAEGPEPDVMQRPPRDPALPIVASGDMWRYVREGAVLAGGALSAYAYGVLRYGPGARAGTVAFDALVLGQMCHALFCRSDQQRSLFNGQLPQNRQLWLAVLASLGLQGLAHLLPGLRRLLGLATLGPADLAAILAGAVLPVLINELSKPGSERRAAQNKAATTMAPAELPASR